MRVVTIGRHPHNEVVLNDRTISRIHCQIIQYDNGGYGITDFGSKNGTYVNGRRIVGEVPLHAGDSVRLGAVDFPWQRYFSTPAGASNFSNGGHRGNGTQGLSAGVIVAIVMGALALIVVVVLLIVNLSGGNSHSGSSHDADDPPRKTTIKKPSLPGGKAYQFTIAGVKLNMDMDPQEVIATNPVATVTKKRTPGYEDEILSVEKETYYLINNNIAVTFQNNQIDHINTWAPSYVTPQGCRVGSTFGDVVAAYPRITFYYCVAWYNYQSLRYENVVYLFDEATCTGFYFYESSFSESEIQGIYEAIGATDAGGSFVASSLSTSIYQSICSTVTVAQISMHNCGNAPSYKPTEKPIQQPPSETKKKTNKYDYKSSIRVTEKIFKENSKGTISLPNGDVIEYTCYYDLSFLPMYCINFKLRGSSDICNKYRIGGFKHIDDENCFLAEKDTFTGELRMTISIGTEYYLSDIDYLTILIQKR